MSKEKEWANVGLREYGGISVQPAGQIIISYRRFGIEKTMNSLYILSIGQINVLSTANRGG